MNEQGTEPTEIAMKLAEAVVNQIYDEGCRNDPEYRICVIHGFARVLDDAGLREMVEQLKERK